jgi:hypothetical protein
MRYIFLASALLLSACSDAPVQNQNDSALLDSMVVMKDTTLPKPQSNVLDTVDLKTNLGLIRPDSAAIAEAMAKNSTAYWEIMDTMTGDLNRDKYMDMLIVLKGQGDTNIDSIASRPLLILTGNADGTLKFAERNDNVVLCYHCGGVYGDPYDGLAIRNGYFSAEHYGGSSDRWTQIITFKYSEKEKTWVLHRDAGISYSVFDPEASEEEWEHNRDQWGKIKFSDYNYE